MVRNYVRKTAAADTENLRKAVLAVKNENYSVRQAAIHFNVGRMALNRQCASVPNNVSQENVTISRPGMRPVISDNHERALMNYILHASDIYFGLSPKEIRKLAYEYGKRLGLSMPPSWDERQIAGEDWFSKFLKRHPNLSIRKPQATSLARATAFNLTTVAEFFKNLKTIYERFQLYPRSIYNMDETGITTVQTPERIVSRRGFKQIGRITSAERGTLVTMALAVSAQGNLVPPFFVFPRVNFKPHFLNNAPAGSAGAANASGWMIAENFLLFLEHFQNNVQASAANPVLLILDNHDSHISIAALEFCQKNCITVLSLPPRCSHKLQPLDRSIFGPLKKAVDQHCDYWMTNNPGKTMSIYDIPAIISRAFPLAVTSTNIMAGFAATGISPFNPDVFGEMDFLPSQVTDRAWNEDNASQPSTSSGQMPETRQELPQASNPTNPTENIDVSATAEGENDSEDDAVQILQTIRPFPKAGERRITRKGRKRKKTAILTDPAEIASVIEEKKGKATKNAPKKTSLARATAFNLTTVAEFFKNLKTIYERFQLYPRSIYNMDETGITTVQTPERIVSRRGFKQIGRITSAERGTLVTMALAVSAQGNLIPPFFVFPRVNFKPHFLNNAPAGSAGAANASGWMIGENFLLFLEHFQNNVQASAANPVLLILDNHDSHISIAALEYCQKNCITVLSLPPHCSHKLQPLDRSIFGPLKKAVDQHCDYWMTNNPGKTMSIYDIPAIISRAFPLAVTSTNIMAGFAATGISPFNPDVFGEMDFLPSQVTDRAWNGDNASQPSTSSGQMPETRQELPQASNPTNPTENIDVSATAEGENDSDDDAEQILQTIRPFPKAGERKITRKGRKRKKTAILTDPAEIASLIEEKKGKATKNAPQKTTNKRSKEEPIRRGRGRPRKVVPGNSNVSDEGD